MKIRRTEAITLAFPASFQTSYALHLTGFLPEHLQLGFCSTSIGEKVKEAARDGDLFSSKEDLSACRNMHQTIGTANRKGTIWND